MTEEYEAYLLWLNSDSPSRAWQRASFAMWSGSRKPLRWMARVLKIDPDDPRAFFALCGFAPMLVDDAWHIAAPVPAVDPFDADALPGDDIVIVNPETRAVSVLGDPGPAIMAPSPQPEALTVHTDPIAWLRHWADERVVWLERRKDAIARARIIPTFNGEPPSALAIGDVSQVPWSHLYARTIKVADFNHAKAIKRAIFRAANLPRVEAA